MDPIIQPTAGTDPAYVPGLTSPRRDEGEEEASEQPAEDPTEEATAEEKSGVEDPEPVAEAVEDDEEEPGEGSGAEPAEGADGPVFEASERRSSIRADRAGIRFRLDEEQAEFRWDEVGAVEIDTPRFARRFSVTVYTTDGAWYQADVEAPARHLLKKWTQELDEVLDVHFEDSGS